MLVLSRNLGQTIIIGDNIRITIVRIGENSVGVGIEAPRSLRIIRGELFNYNKDRISS